MIDALNCPQAPDNAADLGPPAAPKKRGGGPKTPEGKARSKANAMTHGLRAKVLLPEELVAAFEEHKADLTRQFQPRSRYQTTLVGEMAMALARLERCADLAVSDLQRCLDVAEFDWDDDRRTLVEDQGKRLATDASRVAHALEQSKHGADWIIGRWEGIRAVLKTSGSCDEELRRLASDLMGVPAGVRSGDHKVPPSADVAGLSALAEWEIARLRGRQECVLNDRDESRRSMARAGMPYDEDAGTARLRRYESGIRRALSWAHGELRRVQAESATGREAPEAGGADSLRPPMSDSAIKYQVGRVLGSVRPAPATAEEARPGVEEKVAAPSVAVDVDVAVAAAPAVARPAGEVPVVSKAAVVYPVPACTAAHRSAAPRNRFEQRAEKSQARKAARQAAKGR